MRFRPWCLLIFVDYDRPIIVEGYDPSLGTKTYATLSWGLAYDDPTTGKVYHLVINQAIHIPHLDHHLLCLMQCWVNDVIVDNTPKFLTSNPTDYTHALTIKDPDHPTQMVSSHWPYKVWLRYLMWVLQPLMNGIVMLLSGSIWPLNPWPGIQPQLYIKSRKQPLLITLGTSWQQRVPWEYMSTIW